MMHINRLASLVNRSKSRSCHQAATKYDWVVQQVCLTAYFLPNQVFGRPASMMGIMRSAAEPMVDFYWLIAAGDASH